MLSTVNGLTCGFSLLTLQDWDANGTIDFAEFVFSFTSWVDVDEE